MSRRLFAVLTLLSAFSAHAQWLALDDALTRARAENKPLIVYLRGKCDRCNRNADMFIDDTDKHDAIVRAYAPFVRARADAPVALLKNVPAPSIVILEPGGADVMTWRRWDSPNLYMNFLRLLRDVSPELVRASQIRQTDSAAADLVSGNAALDTRMIEPARKLFKRAGDEFRARGKYDLETFARIDGRFAEFLDGNRSKTFEEVQRLIDATNDHATKAHGYVTLAGMSFLSGDRAGLLRAYQSALELAPLGSPDSVEASNQLEAYGVLKRQTNDVAMIAIVAPPHSTITGRAEFSATTAPAVKRVAWFVDGVAVASSETPPFTERLDLGSTPRPHAIDAVAFDAHGGAIATTSLAVNDRLDFRVALVSPVGNELRGRTNVEASVTSPPDHTVKNVELFWNETSLGKFTAPPYRATYDAPNTFGYFRAVATLDDGRTAEETHVVNAPASGETLDVHTIAFAATVVDRNGNRVDGLKASDFKITDAGEPVDLKVRNAEDEPVTIGLAIDSSTSMRLLLLDTIETAWRFLDVAVSPRDRVFLVAFDSQPHLLHSPASDREGLKNAVFDLRPSGSTAVVDAIAFSLQQFTGLPGKKALVLITDGREVTSSQTSAAAQRMAKESGVPIYLVVPRGGVDLAGAVGPADPTLKMRAAMMGSAARTEATPMPSNRPFIDATAGPANSPLASIATASGGAVFFAPSAQDQPAIFTRIRDEVRGQYLLSFVSHAAKAGAWRDVRVGVNRSNATVRTIAGYYAR